MKRTQSTTSNQPGKQPRVIEPRRLTRPRGGAGLEIAAAGESSPEDIWKQQHNEALIWL